jgi:GT2 family glycosyltransferase
LTGFIVVPIYNRIAKLAGFLEELKSQDSPEPLEFIFVDSGSTDGSPQVIQSTMKSDTRFRLLSGNHNWWWARAAHEGLSYALDRAVKGDAMVLLNDDVQLPKDFLKLGLELLRKYPESVWGSGLKIDNGDSEFAVMRNVRDFSVYALTGMKGPEVFEQDLISGRGAFYPASVFLDGATVRYRKIPHYLADYDLSSQAKKLGYKLLGSTRLFVNSGSEFGNSKSQKMPLAWQIFAAQSAFRLTSQFHFWLMESGFGKTKTLVKLIRHRMPALIIQFLKRKNDR